MTTLERVALVAACAIAGTAYMTPTLVSVARLRADIPRILVLNTCLGWTLIGWVWALMLACRRAPGMHSDEWRAWRAGRPEAAATTVAPSTYVDGSYLISDSGDARTWAICIDGRWGIAFELDGIQRTATWVDSSDVPVEVLVQALATREERRR